MHNKGSDQTTVMCLLVSPFVLHLKKQQQDLVFLQHGSYKKGIYSKKKPAIDLSHGTVWEVEYTKYELVVLQQSSEACCLLTGQ